MKATIINNLAKVEIIKKGLTFLRGILYISIMGGDIIFRGRYITGGDIETIKSIILLYPDGGRRFISKEICRVWDWRQPNGQLKDMICRYLLLHLESLGFMSV